MLKVVIADDEERICQLIQALVDWNTLGMEVVGVASNGMEAISLIKEHMPDILITDIRMPGVNGLELIETVKKMDNNLEIIIISGYAHFEYAQTAIKYGVGNYLLKPIEKEELNATLKKLSEKIAERAELENSRIRLEAKNEKDGKRLREDLMQRLYGGSVRDLSNEILVDSYSCKYEHGDCFRLCYIKVDGKASEIGEEGMNTLLEKVFLIAESIWSRHCRDLIFNKQKSGVLLLLCYDPKAEEGLKRDVRNILMQLEVQKNLFKTVEFTIGFGNSVKDAALLPKAADEMKTIIGERLLKGTGRILEKAPSASALHEKNVMEKYLRIISSAISIMNEEEAERATSCIRGCMEEVGRVTGREVLETVLACGGLFITQLNLQNRDEEYDAFSNTCDLCADLDELFSTLNSLQKKHIQMLKTQRENDSVRPIRQAKQYIHNHFSEPITMEEVSSVVGLSPTYFSALFKKIEGEGFAKYLINLRMEEAKTLLRETNISVADICKKVGYNDVKHFNQTFEKAAGVKPATYRKMYG